MDTTLARYRRALEHIGYDWNKGVGELVQMARDALKEPPQEETAKNGTDKVRGASSSASR